jgi:hypothetical protein
MMATIEERVDALEREIKERLARLARRNDAETAELGSDVTRLHATMAKEFDSVQTRLAGLETQIAALPRVLAERLDERERGR